MRTVNLVLFISLNVALCMLLVCTGCGGGGGGGNGPNVGGQNQNFTVGGVVAGLVGSLTLQNNGGDDLVILADGPFTFPSTLKQGASYNVTVLNKSPLQNVAVTNGSGKIKNTNIANINVTCTNRWAHPLTLLDNMSPDGQHAYDINAAINAQGNAIVVWRQSDGTNPQIFMSEFTKRGWTHPADLFDNISPDGQNAQGPRVAMNSSGDAVIAWTQSDGTYLRIFMSERRAGIWTHPMDLTDNISPPGKNANDVDVTINDTGDAIVVWSQSDGTVVQTFMSEYRLGTWDHPDDLTDNISPDGTPVWTSAVAMDNLGDAIIAWPQKNGPFYRLVKSEYRNGIWTHPTSSDAFSPVGKSAWTPEVAMDDTGDAILAWSQVDGFDDVQVFMSEYRSGTWFHPADLDDNISPDGEYAFNPTLAMDDNGDAAIAWYQSDGNNSQIFLSEYRGGVWIHPLTIEDNVSEDGYGATSPSLAMADNGDMVLIWSQFDGAEYQVFKRELREAQLFEPVGIADSFGPAGESIYEPRVVINYAGETLVVWRQSDGSHTQAFKSEFR